MDISWLKLKLLIYQPLYMPLLCCPFIFPPPLPYQRPQDSPSESRVITSSTKLLSENRNWLRKGEYHYFAFEPLLFVNRLLYPRKPNVYHTHFILGRGGGTSGSSGEYPLKLVFNYLGEL